MIEGNGLLEALGETSQSLIKPFLVEVRLRQDQILFEAGEPVAHCYFPLGAAAASYFVLVDDETSVEAVMVGAEGCIGGFVSSGRFPAYTRGVVVQPGAFYRLTSHDLADLMRNSPDLGALLRRYADCLLADLLQTTACNVSHGIEQRAAKWLCAIVERNRQSVVTVTQEQLAARMGSGRSYASRVVQGFKRDGLLRTRRGSIEVLDYERLRQRACRCNDLVRHHFLTVLFNGGEVTGQ
jgi:CRP-like cAMP-binding protein